MLRKARHLGLCAALVASLAAGCFSHSTAVAVGWRADPNAETLLDKVERLRHDGQYGQAVQVGRELLRHTQRNRAAYGWEVVSAEDRVRTLERLSHLPPDAQAEIRRADASEDIILEHRKKREYDAATTLIEEREKIFRRYLGDQSYEVAECYRDLAVILEEQGYYARAEPFRRRSLRVRREVLGREHPEVAAELSQLATDLRELGQYGPAESCLREAFVICSKTRGENTPWALLALNDLSITYIDQGKYAEAEPLLREVLVQRRKWPANPGGVEEALHNLAALFRKQGNYSEAESLFREVLAMRRARLGEDHEAVALNLTSLGAVLSAEGRLDEAESALREALDINKRVLAEDHPEIGKTLNYLAEVLAKKGEYVQAEDLIRQGLAMRRHAYGEDNPGTASSLSSLAFLLLDQGKAGEAEPYLREALDIERKFYGEAHPVVAMGLNRLGQCLLMQGNPSAAAEVLSEAAEVFESARVRAGMGFTRASFLESPYRFLAAARLLCGNSAQAWPAAERSLGRALGDLLLVSDERFLGSGEAAREDTLQRALSQLENEMTALRTAARSDTSPEVMEKVARARDRLLAAEAAWSGFQREIALKYPVTEGQAFSLERVQEALTPQSALIGWLCCPIGRGETANWGYVIGKSGPVRWVRLVSSSDGAEGSDAGGRVSDLREDLSTVAQWPSRVTSADGVAQKAADVWRDWIAPLMPHLKGVKRLVVLPLGPLLGVPVEALVDSTGTSLGEILTVSYAPSATLCTWLWEQGAGRRMPTTRKALLLGDPPFSDAQLTIMEETDGSGRLSDHAVNPSAPISVDVGTLRAALAGDDEVLATLPRLPRTRDEVTRIASVIPGAVILLGPDASEQELVHMAESGKLGRFDTIHLATHAFVDDEYPERSALILSRAHLPDALQAAKRGGRIYDGLLSAKDIVREWHLDADLVTLSACQTALGKQAGGEGYIGLADAFLQAGARSLLVSLWKVDDQATSMLMSRFYENLAGSRTEERTGKRRKPMPKAEALREAKNWLRTYADEQGTRPFAHPAYWSAFILIGEM